MARDLEDIERELCEAIDRKVVAGATVMRSFGGNGETCGCALSLWAGLSNGYRQVAQDAFGWSADQAFAFIYAFDGEEFDQVFDFPGIAALGRRLSRKYIDNAKGGAR